MGRIRTDISSSIKTYTEKKDYSITLDTDHGIKTYKVEGVTSLGVKMKCLR